jgi:hypothetical protein
MLIILDEYTRPTALSPHQNSPNYMIWSFGQMAFSLQNDNVELAVTESGGHMAPVTFTVLMDGGRSNRSRLLLGGKKNTAEAPILQVLPFGLWRSARRGVSLSVFMRAQFWRIRVCVRAKIPEHDQVLHLARVLEHDTGARSRFSAEDLIVGHLNEPDKLRTTQG